MMVSFSCPFCNRHDVEADMTDETYEADFMISAESIASDESLNCDVIKAIEAGTPTFEQWATCEKAAVEALSEIGD